MRKFFIALLILLAIVFFLGRLSEVETMLDTLRRGEIQFILLAMLCICIWQVSVAASYRAIYRAVGIEASLAEMIPLSAASYFTNIIAPSIGASSVALLIDQAKKREISSARVMVASALIIEFDYLGLLCMLGLGFIVLIRRNNLTVTEITASAILISICLGLATLLYLGMHSAKQLDRALVYLTRGINRLFKPFNHRDYLDENRARAFAQDAAQGLHELRHDLRRIVWPAILALTNKFFLLCILFLVFMAFQVPISIGTVVASFGIAHLFVVVSPTPAGLGIVEGALALALISMYVPTGAATVITLAYRAITLWMPLLFGLVSLRWLSRLNTTQQPG